MSVLYIPLDTVTSDYINNSAPKPQVEFSDSFYQEAANDLARFELSQVFKIIGPRSDSNTTPESSALRKYSRVLEDTGSLEQQRELIVALAEKNKADLIAIPYTCTIKYSAIQQQGWRDGKYSGSYERPISYTATAEFHVQLWNKKGELVYERVGIGNTGRPIMYSVFKKRKMPEPDKISSYAKKIFAPPLVRALNESIRKSLRFN